ncbi:hypothetical protein QC762_0046870 [Podospora pseudocomata]|uniref:Uncharacterized protein n=1 Tax=Podospora pseudocomata TaxID=2093779 RepID=A0ABR0GP62_9PEZI|nr:hypothetical protein QC762_0046870 [Podospora pseudocomata]
MGVSEVSFGSCPSSTTLLSSFSSSTPSRPTNPAAAAAADPHRATRHRRQARKRKKVLILPRRRSGNVSRQTPMAVFFYRFTVWATDRATLRPWIRGSLPFSPDQATQYRGNLTCSDLLGSCLYQELRCVLKGDTRWSDDDGGGRPMR